MTRGGRLLIKSDTIVRFAKEHANANTIEVPAGELTVETGAVDLGLHTARGVVKVSQGSIVDVHAGLDKIRFDVTVGQADYEAAGVREQAKTGKGFELVLLPVSVERAAAKPPPPALERAASAPREVAPPHVGKVEPALGELSFQSQPPSATVMLTVGEDATIHDPAPPTDVRILAKRCPAAAVWEFDAGSGRYDVVRVHGASELRARVPLGNYRHRLRCVREGRLEAPQGRSTRLQVLRDAAVRPLPSKPVTITAEADGRRYTVSYQNRLPIVTLRWPDAPRAKEYTLRVTPERGAPFSLQAKQPSAVVAGERLGDGLHRFEFEAGGRRSEQGLLGVNFDFRARTAYLTSPVEGQLASSRSARFAGGSLPGSSVSVEGTALKLDALGRFAGDVPLAAATVAAAVRVVHQSTGVHYYVRHGRAASPP
jgi:hypothetical protein